MKLSGASKLAFISGLVSVLYAPVAAMVVLWFSKSNSRIKKQKFRDIVAWSTIIGVVLSILTALQIQCMTSGGCIFAARMYAFTVLVACMVYVYVLTKSLLHQEKHPELPPQVSSHPVYGVIQMLHQESK